MNGNGLWQDRSTRGSTKVDSLKQEEQMIDYCLQASINESYKDLNNPD
jgi:hypothetical protein